MRSLQDKPPKKKFGKLTIAKGALMRPQLRTPGQIGRGKKVGNGINYLNKSKQSVGTRTSQTQSALQGRLDEAKKGLTPIGIQPVGNQKQQFEDKVKEMQGTARNAVGKRAIKRGGLRQAAMQAVKKKLESMGE